MLLASSDNDADPTDITSEREMTNNGPVVASGIATSQEILWSELAQDVVAAAYMRGHFVLRSGRSSTYYFDKYQLTTKPTVLRRLAEAIAAMIPPHVDRLAGPELGAVPLVAAVSLQVGIPCVFVRKDAKGYGTGRLVEGELYASERVVLIEDVLTTGSEAIKAASSLRDAGARVLEVIGVIDREEGAAANLAAAGLHFRALFTKTSLGLGGT